MHIHMHADPLARAHTHKHAHQQFVELVLQTFNIMIKFIVLLINTLRYKFDFMDERDTLIIDYTGSHCGCGANPYGGRSMPACSLTYKMWNLD